MDIRPIRTDHDSHEALKEIERLWSYPDDNPENGRLDVLATLVEVYEAERWPRRDCSPAEILRYAGATWGARKPSSPNCWVPRHGLRIAAGQAPGLADRGAEDQRRLGHPDPIARRALPARRVAMRLHALVFGTCGIQRRAT